MHGESVAYFVAGTSIFPEQRRRQQSTTAQSEDPRQNQAARRFNAASLHIEYEIQTRGLGRVRAQVLPDFIRRVHYVVEFARQLATRRVVRALSRLSDVKQKRRADAALSADVVRWGLVEALIRSAFVEMVVLTVQQVKRWKLHHDTAGVFRRYTLKLRVRLTKTKNY